jgi:general secretion pathway protein D
MRGVTDEFRDKLNFSLRPQRLGPPDRREQVDRLVR